MQKSSSNAIATTSRLRLVSKSARCSYVSDSRRAASSSSSAGRTPASFRQHTLSLVQAHDYPSYLAAFFYPEEARYDFLALRAFNVELSSVADSVSNAQLGRLRFQWWRDAIASLNTDVPIPHPTVQALFVANRRRKLSTYHLNKLIEARERNLLNPGYNTLSDLSSYAQSTSLSLLLLQMGIVKPDRVHKIQDIPLSTIDHSLSHLATYITVAQTIRSVSFFASKRVMVLPRDVASAHGVVDETLFRALPSLGQEAGLAQRDQAPDLSAFEAVSASCAELVELANLERAKARWTLGLEEAQDEEHAALAQGRKLSRLPKEIGPVFLSAVSAARFFKAFEQTAQGNPFHPSLQGAAKRDWKLPFATWWANWKGQF